MVRSGADGRDRRGRPDAGERRRVPATARAAALTAALLLPFAASAAAGGTDSSALPVALVERAMAAWQVPGLAVAVVRDGRTILARGFGRRDVEGDRPVTPRTLFATGSITKSLTALGIALLAEDGRLDWDRPVQRMVAGFRMHGAMAGATVTLRHMLSHRTGMPRHDALWYLGVFDRAGLVARLRYLPPAAPPGAVFAYSNLMVAAAGHVVERVTATRWEDFTRRRILAPLGMDRARLSLAAFRADDDRAAAYFPADQGRIRIEPRDTDAVAPAAALYADITDMARYVRFHLADGAIDGRRLIARETARSLRAPLVALPDPPPFAEIADAGYALGFYVARYRGHRVVWHPGVIDGYSGMISLLPDDGLGMIVLSNLSGRNPVPKIITYAVYDRLLGLDPLPWLERYEATEPPRPVTVPEPPLTATVPAGRPPAAYEGAFDHPAYGRITIRAAAGGSLAGALHRLRFSLVHDAGDIWRVAETAWPLRRGLGFAFRFDGSGRARAIATPLADGPTYRLQPGDIVFDRAPIAR